MYQELEISLAITAIGVYVVVLGFRENYHRANSLTIFLTSAFIFALITAPLGLNYFQHVLYGRPLELELNFFWGFMAYWVGLRICDSKLPGFTVDWGPQMNTSLFFFGVYYCWALSYGNNVIIFLLLSIPGLMYLVLLPILPWIEESNLVFYGWWK